MGYALSEVIKELMIEQGEGQMNKFDRYYQFGVAGLREFNMNNSGVPKVIELDIDSNDTANLPGDYLQYTRIALCVNGVLYCLSKKEDLCLNKRYDDCGNEIPHVSSVNSYLGYYGYPPNYRNGEFTGGLFGIGGDNNILGYYRVDHENNQIKFSQLTCRASVVMEYIADIDSVNEDFDVHPFCVEALKNWVAWKLKQRGSKPLGEQQLAKLDFRESSRVMKARFRTATADEWLQAFRSGNKRLKM